MGSTVTRAAVPQALAYSDVSTGTLKANWTKSSNPEGTLYAVEVDDDFQFGSVNFTSTTVNGWAQFLNLGVNTTYYARVRAAALDASLSGFTNLGPVSTLANQPKALEAESAFPVVFKTFMTVKWDGNGNPARTGYVADISSNASFNPLKDSRTVLGPSATFYDLTPLVFYFLRVKAFNNSGIETSYTLLGGTSTLENISPVAPTGLDGAWNRQFTLKWSLVLLSEDNTPANDIANYEIHRATSAGGPYCLQAIVASSVTSWTDPNSIAYSAYFYKVRAVDNVYNYSAFSYVVLSDQKIKTEIQSSDGGLTVIIPSRLLTKAGSLLNEDMAIDIVRRKDQETGKTLTSYEIIVTTRGSRPQGGYRFEEPLQYVFKIPVKGGSFAPSAALSIEPESAANTGVFYFNGAEWLRLSSAVSPEQQTAASQGSRSGLYALRQTFQSSDFEILGLEPRKIFTPAGAPPNNQIAFHFTNPKDSQVVEARIYNLRGASTADMQTSEDGTVYVWNGRDYDGNLVPSGVYIYQFKVEGKVFNGTVVVAR
ncbi:MAG: hypothetical protein HY747_05585 [Elusimicrobia bacterium]|nr:hypothetical protein [Elusimicrobiota bacterium]